MAFSVCSALLATLQVKLSSFIAVGRGSVRAVARDVTKSQCGVLLPRLGGTSPSYGVCQAAKQRVSGFSCFVEQRSCHFLGERDAERFDHSG